MQKAHYSPPWANTSIIGVAGSSGSGKTSLSLAIVEALNLPWVVIVSMDSFYKVLTPEQSALAFKSEYDFDSPEAIDFDILVERLKDLKAGSSPRLTPTYVYQEGVVVRDVRDRGRDIEGCIKQWFSFVKPNFHRYVETQRHIADIIVPRGIENNVAIGLVVDHIRKTLSLKSKSHQKELKRLGKTAEDAPLTTNVVLLPETTQVRGINTILVDPSTDRETFIFYFDRIATMLVEKAHETATFVPVQVVTPVKKSYHGLQLHGIISAVVILRGGSIMEPALKRVIPDCVTGRILIQTSTHTTEPELHFRYLDPNIAEHSRVLLLDPQMSSGGAALMAVRVLVDHGVREERIVFITFFAGRKGLGRLMAVFPQITVVACRIGEDLETRWIERKYLGC